VISDDEARANLAQNVNYILKHRGLSQRDLADAVDRHWTSINNVCCNRRLVAFTLVRRIAEALKYTTDELSGSPTLITAEEKRRDKEREKFLIPA